MSALKSVAPAAEPVSTFSLHVSDVSFRLAAEAIPDRNQPPPPELIRPEEFASAFDYGGPAPAGGEPVALAQSQSAHPFLPEPNPLRVSLRTAAAGRAAGRPLSLTVLLDNSGSIEHPDRAGAARTAIRALAAKLTSGDRVTLMTFDREARLAA